MTGINYGIAFILGVLAASGTGAGIYAFFRLLKKKAFKSSNENNISENEQTESISSKKLSCNHMIILENLRRSNQRWTIDLTHDLIIGRQEDCPLKDLKDPSLSRRHCKIIDTDDGPTVWNLSKVNETHVNHAPITDGQILHENDTLTLGREQLRVVRIGLVTDGFYSHQPEFSDDSLNAESMDDSESVSHISNNETDESFW